MKKILVYDYVLNPNKKIEYFKTFSINKDNNNLLYKYFIRTHKTVRELNKIIISEYKFLNSGLYLSLIKLADEFFFTCIRILEIIKDIKIEYPNYSILVDTKYNRFLKLFAELLNYDLENIYIENKIYNPLRTNNIKIFIKIILLLINSFRIKHENIKNIFFLYNDKVSFEFAKPYLDDSLITYPFCSPGLIYKNNKYGVENYVDSKFIVFKEFLKGLRNYRNNRMKIIRSNLLMEIKDIFLSKVFELELNSMTVLSLKKKYPDLENILGIFDAFSSIDYITEKLNKEQNIVTICIPHGINFKYKVHYISYGVNVYTFWSKNHLKRMEDSNLINDTKTNKVLTGNIVYKNTLDCLQNKKLNNKNILVIGEYFPKDDYYTSPFNERTTKELFDTLKNFMDKNKDCHLNIRTRLNDDYCKLALKYVSNNIKISSPNVSIIDEINNSDLIISVFSNSLHEGLLLEKNVLQVNLLGIENYRDLANDNLLFYADTSEKVKRILEIWYKSDLPKSDYTKHLKEYANNGNFEKLDLKGIK